MTTSEPRVERLDESHDLAAFLCGNNELDDWLRRRALAAQAMDTARTFVLVSHPKVIGYFSLTMGSVQRHDAPAKLVRGLPRYPIGMVLLARLAVDSTVQGQGLGGRLLAHALRRAVVAGEAAAARLVVVDAIDEAAVGFYERHGFTSMAEHPQRLCRRTRDIRTSLSGDP